MVSIGGVSSSNSMSSLMRSANMISGLASGLDTESMIENLVKGYQTKIQQLNQKITKTEWKQDSYRSIIQKMVGFSSKYTSYASSTNLMSPSFFNSNVKVETQGKYADKVSASGKPSSEISLDAVKQLATSAVYRTDASRLSNVDNQNITGKSVDLFASEGEDAFKLSSLSGSLSLKYGSKTVSISFNEIDDAEALAEIKKKYAEENDGKEMGEAEALAALMNDKLKDQDIVFNGGKSESADKRIQFEASQDGKSINVKELGNAANGVTISGASGNVKEKLGLTDDDLENVKDKPIRSFGMDKVLGEDGKLVRELSAADYLVEKTADSKDGLTMNISLDGTTKQIKMPKVEKKDGDYLLDGKKVDKDKLADEYAKALNKAVNEQFKGGKIEVTNKREDGKLELNFKVKNEGSDLVVNTDVGDALGIGRAATSFLSTGKTLGDLLGDKLDIKEDGKTGIDGMVQAYERDEKGNYKLKDGKKILAKDNKGDPMFDFEINGKVVGSFSKNSTLADVMSAINSDEDANVSVSYSKLTNSFTFKSKETGLESKVEMGKGLAQGMFGSTEVSDPGSKSFTDSYGIDWLNDGEKESLTFSVPGADDTFDIEKGETIESVVKRLNESFLGSNYEFSCNKYSGQIEASDKKSGAAVDLKIIDKSEPQDPNGDLIEFDKSKAPSINYTPGQDAKFTVTVNGETKEMTRSSNTVDIDGMKITMKGTFAAEGDDEKVTFTSKTDSDKIISAIKDFAKDYNEMMTEIKTAYNTMPYRKSSGSFANYEPLTDDEKEGMSESAIERYEEKAKQGILFGDRNLSALYNKMSQAFSFSNTKDIDALKDAGISLTFDISSGTQTLSIDEEKLRNVLDSDPDRIADVFTKTDGVMDRMKTQLDAYAKTTGEPKGILIQQSGSPLSSLSLMNNQWQNEIDNYNTQIEKWQDKLTSQVDRYTQQFSRLEQLINQMNSQSSTLAGMMGG